MKWWLLCNLCNIRHRLVSILVLGYLHFCRTSTYMAQWQCYQSSWFFLINPMIIDVLLKNPTSRESWFTWTSDMFAKTSKLHLPRKTWKLEILCMFSSNISLCLHGSYSCHLIYRPFYFLLLSYTWNSWD